MILKNIFGREEFLLKVMHALASWDFSIWWNKKEAVYTDAELVQYILDGKKEYFEIIVDRRWQKLFRYLYYYFAFVQDTAEDALQEVFIHVWKKLDAYDQTKTFSTWLYTIARNRILDRIRDNKHEKNKQYIEQWDELVDPLHTEDLIWEKKLLHTILKQLKNEYKEVIILYYFEAYSYDEIAVIIWSNKNSVGTLLNRAKKEIKVLIEWDALLTEALELAW